MNGEFALSSLLEHTEAGVAILRLAVVGGAVSAYHYLIEWHPSLGAGTCDITAPCTVPWFRQFGFVSLAFMALCGFAAIVALLTLGSADGANHGRPDKES